VVAFGPQDRTPQWFLSGRRQRPGGL